MRKRKTSRPNEIEETDKIYPSNQLTITSCILMNNFNKTIELLDDIEHKLTNKSELKRVVIDQLESIKLILKEDLQNMLVEYSLEYEMPLLNACNSFQLKMYANKADISNSSHITLMKNLIDQTLFNIFNDRFMICKIVLFDSIFRQLLEQIFKVDRGLKNSFLLYPVIIFKIFLYNFKKLTVKCVECSIILSRDALSSNHDGRIDSEADSSDSSSSSHHDHQTTAGFGIFSKLGTFFHRAEKLETKEKSLLNEFQFKTIQHCLKNIVDFFSGDEEFLKKDYLTSTNEYQSALKTLDLYLNSSSQLIAYFVRTQNIEQNNIDFRQCFGKLRAQVEIKQNMKLKTEFSFSVRIIEARFLTWCNNSGLTYGPFSGQTASTTYVEIYALGPFPMIKHWPKKLVNASHMDQLKEIVYFEDDSFEFKINVSSQDAKKLLQDKKFLDNYEIEMIVREISSSGQTSVIGVAVFNLSQSVQSAHVWKKLIHEEQIKEQQSGLMSLEQKMKYLDLNAMGLYGKMDFWSPLRPKLKINDYGHKVLKVLEKHANDKRAIEFVRFKGITRNNIS